MNDHLWQKILHFDMDQPFEEYGFSVRLAAENFWTKNFTALALLEYKKFMYLAATSSAMVSPSEIVDTVWHQHLIFTRSYAEFCALLGKTVQHIPSTHNRELFQQFKMAKERTAALYEEHFGVQPQAVWHYSGMYESLLLKKAKWNLRTFINFGILAFCLLTIPFYFALKPIMLKVGNPGFMISYGITILLFYVFFHFYNSYTFKKILKTFSKDSFIYELHPYELIHLKNEEVNELINGSINELLENHSIIISQDNAVELQMKISVNSAEERQIISLLTEMVHPTYDNLLRKLKRKPVFTHFIRFGAAFQKYFLKSEKFAFLFYTNFAASGLLLMIGLIRFVTGFLRDKPLQQLIIGIIILLCLIAFHLKHLSTKFTAETLPDFYKKDLLPRRDIENNWQWKYFLLGSVLLAPVLIPEKKITGDDGEESEGDTCGSSCDSCGGCGGD